MDREVIDIPKIILEWSDWIDWQDIKADKRLKANKDKEIPPESAGVYEVKYKNDEERLYIGRSRGGLRQRVREELVKGFKGSDGKPVHPAWQPITSSEDVSKIVVRWAITDRPAAVEEDLHMKYRERFGKLPKHVKRT